MVSHFRSFSAILNSATSGSAKTATVMVDVCRLPCRSVGGTRCQRCPPDSLANVASAPLPVILSIESPANCSTMSNSKTPPHRHASVDGDLVLD
jgi:hypothetical protein